MQLSLSIVERLARARADMRIGLPVVLQVGDERVAAAAVETLAADRACAMAGVEGAVLAITARRAATLKAAAYDGDIARIRVPRDVDAGWLRAVADPAGDLDTPLKGPFRMQREGAADLARAAIRLAKAAHLLPAVLVVPFDGSSGQATVLDLGEAAPHLEAHAAMHPVVHGRVPLAASEAGEVHVFRPGDGGEEHYAVEIGRPPRAGAPLVRLHSACFTGDVLGSLKCDCGPQLSAALAAMGAAGEGVLLYLNQEGRGIGLANKMRAYALQDQGFDTVEANHRLGFEDDERDFRLGADILRRMGFGRIRLMTNNPAKVAMMAAQGIEVVERVPLAVGLNPLNARYLDTKAKKSGHIL